MPFAAHLRRTGLGALCALVALASLASGALAETQTAETLRNTLDSYRVAQAFDCSDQSCKRLRSCEEACYKLLQCGQSKRDGDHDGIPCENLCSRRC